MMKKLCLVKYDMTDASGGARVTANLANTLSEWYEVHVVSICSNQKDTFYPLAIRVHYGVLIRGVGRIRNMLPEGIKRLRRYIKENSIDLVMGIGVSIAPFIVPASKGLSCRTVSCEHLNCMNEYENHLGHRICRLIGAKLCDRVVVLTYKDKEAYSRKFKLRPEKVEYIYNWIDDQLLDSIHPYNSSSKKIISVMRVEPVKGAENIIKCASLIFPNHPDWQWHIYGGGEGEYMEKLKSKLKEKRLEDHVFFKGKVKDIYERYKEYGLFVLTSYCEGLPMVLIEAKAMKIPIISFDCLTGPSEIIRDGIDGYLVPVGDNEQLAAKLDVCMESRKLRELLSENAYGNLKLFSKKDIIEKWRSFIEDTCK